MKTDSLALPTVPRGRVPCWRWPPPPSPPTPIRSTRRTYRRFQVHHIGDEGGGPVQRLRGHGPARPREAGGSLGGVHDQDGQHHHRRADRDEHLKSPDFFDVAKNPTITFKSTTVTPAGKDAYKVNGNLTLRGVTKQVTLPVEFHGDGRTPGATRRSALRSRPRSTARTTA